VTERPGRTAQGYRRFRCRQCGKQFNECNCGLLKVHEQQPGSFRREPHTKPAMPTAQR